MLFGLFKRKPLKICKDCKFYKKNIINGIEFSSICSNPKISKLDLITGEYYEKYCDIQRRWDCGKQAKYFEPKEE
jgi:hypothetical protein